MIAPGTEVRDGLDRIVHGRTGALVTLGNNARLQSLATGGFAEKLAPICPVIRDVRPELLLEGLRQLWLASSRPGGRK